MKPLTSFQVRWLEAVLANDENASDEGLVEYFLDNGLDAEQAAFAISCREDYQKNIEACSLVQETQCHSHPKT